MKKIRYKELTKPFSAGKRPDAEQPTVRRESQPRKLPVLSRDELRGIIMEMLG